MGLGIGFRVGPVYYHQRLTPRRTSSGGCLGCIVWPFRLMVWLLVLECVAIAAMCVYTVLIYGWMVSVLAALIASAIRGEPIGPTVRNYQAWVVHGFRRFHQGIGRMMRRLR